MEHLPVVFLAHGAPPLLDDHGWMKALAEWARGMPRPKAILVLSAHWEARPVAFGALETVPLVYDFYGFPERYYAVKYPAPGAPALAALVKDVLEAAGVPCASLPAAGTGRGLDHGAFVPLVAMYPNADVPVLQVSLPSMEPRELFKMGQALAPLRAEGVLVMGSGFLTHNMRTFGLRETPAWASEFDQWCGEVLGRRDFDALQA